MKTSKIRTSVCSHPCWIIGSKSIDSVLPIDADNNVKRLPIDPFAGLSFMVNEQGWLKNDIQAYEDTQNVGVARAILQRCPVFSSDKPDNLTLDERLSQIIPSNCSSPSEFVKVSRQIAAEQYARQVAREKALYEAQKAKIKSPKKVDVEQKTE